MAVEFKKGIGSENPSNGSGNLAGLYRHKETGSEIGFIDNELGFGKIMADAAVRMGYEYVGPLPEGYDKATFAPFTEASHQREMEGVNMKGVLARLELLEQENMALKAQTPTGSSTEVSTPTEIEVTPDTTEETSTEAQQPEDMSLNSRRELEVMALEAGVEDPGNLAKYPSKSVLIQAIKEKNNS